MISGDLGIAAGRGGGPAGYGPAARGQPGARTARRAAACRASVVTAA